MSIGLLAPLFLAGLVAVAIPVIVHLVRREEQTSFAFPSLMFLRDIPVREHRRRTIRHWWLLALRCLIVALLCIAFAQPIIEWSSDRLGPTNQRVDRIILLDRSHSMAAGSAWADATTAAREAVASLRAGDRAALVLFDHETLLSQEMTTDRAALQNALAGARIGDGHTELTAAIIRAGAMLEASDAATREIVLISDFQRSATTAGEVPRIARGIDMVPVPVGGAPIRNLAVAAVTLEGTPLGEGGAVDVTAHVVNTGSLPVTDADLVLEVDAERRERRVVSLEPGAAHDASFRLVLAPDELARVRVHVSGDDLPADDSRHLLVSGPSAISVLLLEERGARPEKSLHLRQALRQGAAPAFRVTPRSVSQLRASDIDAADAIVINDAPIPGGELGEKLGQFLEDGGGLLVATGQRVQGAWPGGDRGLVPGRLGAPVTRPADSPASILRLDTLHPALAAFEGSDAGDLSGARFHRYRPLTAVDGDRVLARYDDEAVAIAERVVGKGRTLVLTSTLDPSWNTLALEPGYLPFLHEALRYLASHVPAVPAVSVGDTVDLQRYARGLPGYTRSAAALARGAVTTLRTPSGRQLTLGPGDAFAALDEAGFHEAHVSGGGGRSLVIAANPTTRESEPAVLDVDAFLAAIRATAPESPAGAPGEVTAMAAAKTVSDDVWWFLLLACVVLLGLDTLFSNRLSHGVQAS